jgi:hypothetical protein
VPSLSVTPGKCRATFTIKRFAQPLVAAALTAADNSRGDEFPKAAAQCPGRLPLLPCVAFGWFDPERCFFHAVKMIYLPDSARAALTSSRMLRTSFRQQGLNIQVFLQLDSVKCRLDFFRFHDRRLRLP